MDTGIPLRAADTLRPPFDHAVIGISRLARAPHIVHGRPRSTQVSRAAYSPRSPPCRTSAMWIAAASGRCSMVLTGRAGTERRGQAAECQAQG